MKKEKKKDRNDVWIPASFTIEAALICPIVLLAIFTLLCHAFTLHDRVMERTALSLKLSGAASCRDPEEETSGESDSVSVILDGRIFSLENEICITPGILRICGSVGSYEESRSTLRPEDILRKKVLFEEGKH